MSTVEQNKECGEEKHDDCGSNCPDAVDAGAEDAVDAGAADAGAADAGAADADAGTGNPFSMEQMADYIAFNVNAKGREMVQNLNKTREDLDQTKRKLLKEKIAIKKVERGGKSRKNVDYSNLRALTDQYNTLLGVYNKSVTTLQAQRQSLAIEGMESIQVEEADKKAKARKAQKKREKRKKNQKSK